MDKLALLNECRVSLGKPALKSWKGSKAKLEKQSLPSATQSRRRRGEGSEGRSQTASAYRALAGHRSEGCSRCAT